MHRLIYKKNIQFYLKKSEFEAISKFETLY